MTLREIIFDIQETLNAYSDDSKFSEEHIAFMVSNVRNMLLKQYMSSLIKEIPREAIQSICLKLELDRNCFEEINVLRSNIRVPSTLDNTGRSNIINAYLGTRFVKNLNIIDYNRLPYVGQEKYNDLQMFVAIDTKSYLVLYNSDNRHLMLEDQLIEVEGVFENPEEAYELSCDKSESDKCDFYDAQYPIESSLITPLKNQIVQELLMKLRITKDEINDGEDSQVSQDNRRRRRNEGAQG